jgi:hypothetical protein
VFVQSVAIVPEHDTVYVEGMVGNRVWWIRELLDMCLLPSSICGWQWKDLLRGRKALSEHGSVAVERISSRMFLGFLDAKPWRIIEESMGIEGLAGVKSRRKTMENH